jgi:hypothetical protein
LVAGAGAGRVVPAGLAPNNPPPLAAGCAAPAPAPPKENELDGGAAAGVVVAAFPPNENVDFGAGVVLPAGAPKPKLPDVGAAAGLGAAAAPPPKLNVDVVGATEGAGDVTLDAEPVAPNSDPPDAPVLPPPKRLPPVFPPVAPPPNRPPPVVPPAAGAGALPKLNVFPPAAGCCCCCCWFWLAVQRQLILSSWKHSELTCAERESCAACDRSVNASARLGRDIPVPLPNPPKPADGQRGTLISRRSTNTFSLN